MQVMGVTGKIYGLKSGMTASNKDKATFRVGVRKQYVSDEDKANKTTMTFMPMMASGPTAKFINTYFKEGDSISVGRMEYKTFRSQKADPANNFDDSHIFMVDSVGFVGEGNGGGSQQQAAPAQQSYQQAAAPAPQSYQQPPAQQSYQQPPAQQGYQQPPAQQGYQQPPAQQPAAVGAGASPFDPGYSPNDDLPF